MKSCCVVALRVLRGICQAPSRQLKLLCECFQAGTAFLHESHREHGTDRYLQDENATDVHSNVISAVKLPKGNVHELDYLNPLSK